MSSLIRILSLLAPALACGQTLRLEDVLESVRKNYPPLLAAVQEIEIAAAETLQAEGRFDTVLRGRWDSDNLGFYSNRNWDVSVEQPTAIQGLSLLSGYRLGDGTYPAYEGKLATRSGGEWRAGLRLPLLRDRAIDSRRADLSKARIGQQVARLSVQQQKLGITLLASRRYWDWVAAGRRYRMAEEVLRIAQSRQNFLDESVKGGLLPAIDAADNRRAVLQRRGQMIEIERSLQQAAIELSLFYRDAGGRLLTPTPDQLPHEFPPAYELTPDTLETDAGVAIRRRPEIPRLAAQRDQLAIEASLARNARLPAVDFFAGFTSESGTGPVRRGPQELRAGLSFELPWQRRTATGRQYAAEARIEQVRQRTGFTVDQVGAEVRDAASAVRTAYGRLLAAREEVEVSRQLEDAERSRFDLGEGTLFQLNLREAATIESLQREISAQADYHRSHAAYTAAIGIVP